MEGAKACPLSSVDCAVVLHVRCYGASMEGTRYAMAGSYPVYGGSIEHHGRSMEGLWRVRCEFMAGLRWTIYRWSIACPWNAMQGPWRSMVRHGWSMVGVIACPSRAPWCAMKDVSMEGLWRVHVESIPRNGGRQGGRHGALWQVHGGLMEGPWLVHGVSMEGPWRVNAESIERIGGFMESPWYAMDGAMACAQSVMESAMVRPGGCHGGSMEGCWRVPGVFLDGPWSAIDGAWQARCGFSGASWKIHGKSMEGAMARHVGRRGVSMSRQYGRHGGFTEIL